MSVPPQSRKKNVTSAFHHQNEAQPLIRLLGDQSQYVPPLGILFGPFYWLSHKSVWFEWDPKQQAELEAVQEAVAHSLKFGAPFS